MIAAIVGSAVCAGEDFDRASEFLSAHGRVFEAIFAVNSVGETLDRVDWWVTLHPELMPGWIKRRAENGFPPARGVIAHSGNTLQDRGQPSVVDEIAEYRFPGQSVSGSSGHFAVKIAMEKGFTRRILCGVPMSAEMHRDDGKPWRHHDMFRQGWEESVDHYAAGTRSMGGWTMELLGAPDEAWLT